MPTAQRLLIAVPPVWLDAFVGPDELARLQSHYPDTTVLPQAGFAPDAWRETVLHFRPTAILTGWGAPPVPAEAMPPLAIVAHTAGSVRTIVTREMIERGLIVTNWGPAAAPAVAECALLLTLACLRRLNAWSFTLHQERGWIAKSMSDNGVGLYGRRVGIHGFGNIARQFLRLIEPFGCDVRAYSHGVPASVYAEHGVRQADSLEELFRHAEVLVDVEALSPANRGSVTEAMLRLLPPTGVFVNVGRGAVVDERALERIAMEGNLQIGLDVYEKEPLPPTSPLRGLPNVTLLPHVAGPTQDQRRACGLRAVESLCRFARGEPVEQPVSADAYDRST